MNNAGIIRRADAIDFSEQDWDDVMNVNLKSTFFLSQAVARRMLADGMGGKIINIASLLSFQGGIRIPSYTASKSGLAGLDAPAGLRMGRERHQRERNRTGLFRDEQYRGSSR